MIILLSALEFSIRLKFLNFIESLFVLFSDLPWEEDDNAADVVFISDPQHFNRFFKKEKGRVLVMFYAVSTAEPYNSVDEAIFTSGLTRVLLTD